MLLQTTLLDVAFLACAGEVLSGREQFHKGPFSNFQSMHHLYCAMKFIPPGRFRNLPSDSRDEVDLACGRSRNLHWDLEGAKLGIYIRVKEIVIYLNRYRRCFQ